jgi:hypothetical protein
MTIEIVTLFDKYLNLMNDTTKNSTKISGHYRIRIVTCLIKDGDRDL